MTEQEWHFSGDPAAMLAHVQGKVSDRRLRLWACACCRVQGPGVVPHVMRSVEAAEKFADTGSISPGERSEHGAWTCTPEGLQSMLRFVVGHRGADPRQQAALLRDIVGSPFRPVTWACGRCGATRICGHWTACPVVNCAAPRPWATPTVLALAQAAYDLRRDDGTLDPHRLAVLADALEDDRCADAAILTHLRGEGPCHRCGGRGTVRVKDESAHGDTDTVCCPVCNADPTGTGIGSPATKGRSALPGPHVRGCWALDLLLARE
jgi:hypothetical protein